MEQNSAIAAHISAFAQRESLPATFVALARQWYWPLCQELAGKIRDGELKVLGISGTQGSGKSTLANLLQCLLSEQGIRAVALSLDDFYLTRAERAKLADAVHPLLATRGVPGSHDIALANATIDQLLSAGEVKVPRFDKANDDRVAAEQWECVSAPVDLVIVEGWCLGLPPQSQTQLQTPVNDLEKQQDPDGRWRQFVNQSLDAYQVFFHRLDFLVYLKSPDFAAVKRWRGKQEQKLAHSTDPAKATRIMDERALTLFLQHYQRLTLHGFDTLPSIADVIFTLNDQQQITQRINRP